MFLLSPHLCPQAVHNLPCCIAVCVRPRCPAPPRVVPAVPTYAPPLHGSRMRRARSLLVVGGVCFMVDAGGVCACTMCRGALRCTVTAPSSLVLPTLVLSEVPSLAWPTIQFHSALRGPSSGPLGAGSPGCRRTAALCRRVPKVGSLGACTPARTGGFTECIRGPSGGHGPQGWLPGA